MLHSVASSANDPLGQFKDGAWVRGSDHPMPLVGTNIGIRILGGLGIVRTERTFRNAESQSIEATITFPVPVHATLVALTAAIDGCTLTGRAQRRQQARDTYEGAMDAGRTAILHEEAIRGIHMLSVGHVPPGKEVKVTSIWAMPLSWQGGRAHLRVPTTIGDVYGRSPLPDSDDLVHAPVVHRARLTVSSDSGAVAVDGVTLHAGGAEVLLNKPIDILLSHWVARPLAGVAANGDPVALSITPAPEEDAPLDAALLLDQSGSMNEPVTDEPRRGAGSRSGIPTKHQAMLEGLRPVLAEEAARTRSERLGRYAPFGLRLWQFNTECTEIGSLDDLEGPDGGTAIGNALATVIGQCEAADICIVTDGKSHALDVQELVRTGRRFTVVLVGKDSLDAQFGHLAALSGGELFVVPAADTADAIRAAMKSLRRHHLVQPAIRGLPQTVSARIGGMDVSACWGRSAPKATGHVGSRDATRPGSVSPLTIAPPPIEEGVPGIGADESRWIGAVAAVLAIPHMDEEAAAG